MKGIVKLYLMFAGGCLAATYAVHHDNGKELEAEQHHLAAATGAAQPVNEVITPVVLPVRGPANPAAADFPQFDLPQPTDNRDLRSTLPAPEGPAGVEGLSTEEVIIQENSAGEAGTFAG